MSFPNYAFFLVELLWTHDKLLYMDALHILIFFKLQDVDVLANVHSHYLQANGHVINFT